MTTTAKPDAVKINCLQIENVKRVSAVQMECGENALTIIGGKNGQGKTSVLDAIMWALGGDRFRPTNPIHEGAEEASVSVQLSNGITVERGGKNGAMKVIGANGKGGQALLGQAQEQAVRNLQLLILDD
jgi:recombinational DNA repair ATPase RecF